MNKPHDHDFDKLPLPEWKLERFLVGELPAAEMREIQARLDSEPALALRMKALQAEYSGLLAAHPSAGMCAGIERRLRSSRPAPRPRDWAFPTLRWPQARVWAPAFGMILVLAVLPFTSYSPFSGTDRGQEEGDGGESTRIKGLEPGLILYRKTPGGTQKLRSGEAARAGDLIQIHYESAGRAYGALFSLDAEGKVTRHLPDRGNLSVTLAADGPVPLEFAYELDAAPGWERFYLVTSDRPFPLEDVESALKKAAGTAESGAFDSLFLPVGLRQSKFILLKESGT